MRRVKTPKLLRVLLTVIMTAGILPAAVFAQDGFPPQEENTSIVEPPQADPLPVDPLPEDTQDTSSPAENLPAEEPEAEESPVEQSSDALFSGEPADGESSSEKTEDNNCKDDSVTVRKVNENGEELAGAVFTIYPDAACDENSAIKTFPAGTYTLSTADSDLKSLMPSAGTDTSLYLKETTAPAGYEKETAVYLITIHADEDDASSSLVYTMTIGDDHKKELTVVNSPLSVASEAEEAVTPELMPSSRSLRNLNPDQGSILIPFVKKWSGESDSSVTRPASITVSLYKYLGASFDISTATRVASRTLSPATAWSCEFDISSEPLYSGTAAYKWAVAENPVAGYTETAHTDPVVVFNPPEIAGDGWNRITPCSEINITTSGNEKSIVCAKKGNTYIIWSSDPLSAAERQLVFQSAAAGIQGIGNPQYGAVTFISGFGTSSEFGLTVTESQIQFNNPSNWSFFATGIYNKSSAQTHASSITNSYTPVSAALAIPVTKIINGIPAATGTFTFILTGNTPGAPMPETGGETLTVTGSATGTFGNITYTAPGTWTYSVSETTGTEAGYSYDPTVYLITVTVTDTNGVLSAVPSFQTTAGDPADRITFTNTYSAGNLIVKKTTAGNAPIAGKEFRFTVTLSDSSINGSYGGMTFTNGAASFTLKGGEELKAENLPNGVSFVVAEAAYTGDGYVTQKTGDTGTIIGNGELTASFTNTRNAEGSLTVSKKLEGNDTDHMKEFIFTINLSDRTLSGTYSGVVFTNGVATITLKGGQTKTIEGLPNGIGYTVTETDYSADGYTTNKTGDTGTIDENVPVIAAFTNIKNTFGDLIVKKTAAGNAPIAGKEFRFTVTLSDTSINGSYGEMTFTNGMASFTLKGGEELKAEDLPNGVSFVVTEADYTGDGYVTQKTGDTGTILGNGELTASFTNTRNLASPDPGYGNLMIKKTVSGNLADYGAFFSFTIVIHAEGTFSYTGSKNGTVKSGDTILLKHGESITIGGLPAGTAYSVTESGNTGYLVHASGNAGTIAANHTSIAAFTNKKYQVPYTADKSKPPLRFDITLLSGLGILLLVLSQRKRNA